MKNYKVRIVYLPCIFVYTTKCISYSYHFIKINIASRDIVAHGLDLGKIQLSSKTFLEKNDFPLLSSK